MSIATLTLNPAIDVAYALDRLMPTDKLRAEDQQCDPGGGGINVARMFVRLGGNARCIYLSGGAAGIALDALLDAQKLLSEPVPIKGETRISVNLFEKATAQEYRVVPAGPVVSTDEWQICLDRLSVTDCDYLVMSGSLPRGVPSDFYARAAATAHKRGVRTILDSSGEALKAAVSVGGLELIKPNLKEFQNLIGKDICAPAAIGEAAQRIVRDGGARLVAVSMAERGGILAASNTVITCSAPMIETKSSVGAGDTCVAAMVHALSIGQSDTDAFRRAIAAGTAALLTPGTDLAQTADIERLFAQCRVTVL